MNITFYAGPVTQDVRKQLWEVMRYKILTPECSILYLDGVPYCAMMYNKSWIEDGRVIGELFFTGVFSQTFGHLPLEKQTEVRNYNFFKQVGYMFDTLGWDEVRGRTDTNNHRIRSLMEKANGSRGAESNDEGVLPVEWFMTKDQFDVFRGYSEIPTI